jgi:hypothetical protein
VVTPSSTGQLETFVAAKQLHDAVDLTVDSKDFSVLSVRRLNGTGALYLESTQASHYEFTVSEFVPTKTDISQMARIFKNMNTTWKVRSQCYQRAMTWVYDSYVDDGVQSRKAFLFFTRKYIQQYDYKWWFHVAPLYTFRHPDDRLVDMVLDRTFFDSPETIKDWTDAFIKSHQECPVVEKYSDYRNNQMTNHCYLMLPPMYYYQPLDLEAMEGESHERGSFNQANIDHAHRAFRRI